MISFWKREAIVVYRIAWANSAAGIWIFFEIFKLQQTIFNWPISEKYPQ